jgi:peptidoglycan/LPS O-acetylase OafA/YrhL
VLPQFRADSLAIGALIAFWRSYRVTDEFVVQKVKRWFRMSLICLPLLWVSGTSAFHAAAWCHTLMAAFFGTSLFLVLENRGSPRLAFLCSPIAAFFAKTSYTAYLIHDVVGYLLFTQLGQPRTLTTLSGVALTVLAFVVTFAICAFSYRYFESPLIKFGHRRFSFGPMLRGAPVVAG